MVVIQVIFSWKLVEAVIVMMIVVVVVLVEVRVRWGMSV